MKNYIPTKQESTALLTICPAFWDAICINNDYFNDEDTTNEQRAVIKEATREIYKAALIIFESVYILPFG